MPSKYEALLQEPSPSKYSSLLEEPAATSSRYSSLLEDSPEPPPPSTTPVSDQAVAEPNTVAGKLGEVWRGIDIKSLPADVGKALVGLIGATESPKAFKQAWDVLHGVPVAQAIPESQTFVGIEKKPIQERAKIAGNELINVAGLWAGGKAAKEAVGPAPETAGTIPAPAGAPPVVGNEQFARVAPVNERAGAAVPADNPAPAQSTILESATQPEPKLVVPNSQPQWLKDQIGILNQNAEQAGIADQIEKLSAQRLTAGQVAQKLGTDTETVRAVRSARGIPSMDEAEFDSWLKTKSPITEENAAQAATDIGGLSYGGVQSWPADSGIPSTLEFTITEPGKETTLSVPPGITPEELITRRDQKLADFAAKEQPTEPAAAQPEPEPPAPPAPVETRVTDTEPHISAIANRFTQERAARGEIGEVAPGQGVSTVDLTQRGLNMAPEEVNQHISDVMNDAGGDPKLQASAIRGEEARLSKRSHDLSRAAEANPTDINARIAADNAFKDLTDFHNGPVAKLKNNWHAQGMAIQGEVPVDLSTLNGLREAWLKDTGKAPPASIEPTLRKTAEQVRKTVQEENGAMQQLGQEIDKVARSRKLPTADEVRANIRERMGLGPCKV